MELDQPDPVTGHTHRVQLALDTTLMPGDQSFQYMAPERADAEKSRDFRFVSDPARMDWFLRRLQPGDEDLSQIPFAEIADAMRGAATEVIGCTPSPLQMEAFAKACDLPFTALPPDPEALTRALAQPQSGPRMIEIRVPR